MDRRHFLTRSGIALGALLVGDDVLEAMDRLTHRKVFALGGVYDFRYRFLVSNGAPYGSQEWQSAIIGLTEKGEWRPLSVPRPMSDWSRKELAYQACKKLRSHGLPYPERLIRV